MSDIEIFLLVLVIVMAIAGGFLFRQLFAAHTEIATALGRAEAAEAKLRAVEGVEPRTRIEDSGLTPTDITLAHEYESEGVEDAQELDPPLKDYPHGFGMPVGGKWEQ